MSRMIRLIAAVIVAAGFSSCASTGSGSATAVNLKKNKAGSVVYRVKTTAYCHMEKDSLRYGRGSATGNMLKYGQVRSAAADWSVFPVGTVFRIIGESNYYQVDDYGRALVGTKTLDLYRPTLQDVKKWGARKVDIEVVQWGCYDRSLNILKDRTRHAHVKMMVKNILKKNRSNS
jgi:3D (Asp-Asp-Asp) domain-containing protein